MRMARIGPYRGIARERRVHDRLDVVGMADGGHSPDHLPGDLKDVVGVGPMKMPAAELPLHLLHVDTMRTGGEDEQRPVIASEDEAIGDGADVTATGRGGLRGGACRLVQSDDRTDDPLVGEDAGHAADPWIVEYSALLLGEPLPLRKPRDAGLMPPPSRRAGDSFSPA